MISLWRNRLLMTHRLISWYYNNMIFLLSCAPTLSLDSATSVISDWPDTGIHWETPFSLVYNGTLLHNQQVISATTAPAGIEHPTDFPFQVHSLQSESLDFSGSWLNQEPFFWTLDPPIRRSEPCAPRRERGARKRDGDRGGTEDDCDQEDG